jgi:hypothetical protein
LLATVSFARATLRPRITFVPAAPIAFETIAFTRAVALKAIAISAPIAVRSLGLVSARATLHAAPAIVASAEVTLVIASAKFPIAKATFAKLAIVIPTSAEITVAKVASAKLPTTKLSAVVTATEFALVTASAVLTVSITSAKFPPALASAEFPLVVTAAEFTSVLASTEFPSAVTPANLATIAATVACAEAAEHRETPLLTVVETLVERLCGVGEFLQRGAGF